MALEKIGLEAILKDEDFQKGLASYIKGVDLAVKKTDQAGAEISKSTATVGKAWQAGAKKAGIAMTAMGAAGAALLTKLTMTAARTEELGIVLNTVGRNIGKTTDQMQRYEDGVKSMGITTQASRQAIIQMVQANLDLEKSTELARLAQDAAVIAQLDSSQAFQTLITVIQRGSLVMARTLGLTVDFQGAYKKLADELGITTTALTQQQKIQARTNEVLAQSVNIAGTYEAAMGSAGKQLRSMSRHIEELQNELGSTLLPLMGEIVGATTDFLKTLREMDPVLKTSAIEFAAIASAVLLVGGALTAAAPGIIAVSLALGGLALPILVITGLVVALAAAVIYLGNVEKAAEEAAAEVLDASDSFAEYTWKMEAAGEETRALTEDLYDLAKASKTIDLLQLQRAAEDMKEAFTEQGEAIAAFEAGLISNFDVMSGGLSVYDETTDGIKDYIKTLDAAGLRIASGTDAIYDWLRAAGASESEARDLAEQYREVARAQQLLNLVMESGSKQIGRYDTLTGKLETTLEGANERHRMLAERTAATWAEIVTLAEETGLATELVRKFKVELGYTDDEIKKVAEDLHLTGKEMDDLAKKTGLSKERIKELNKTLGQDEIEDYADALEDAADATEQTVQAIDLLVQSSGWAADDIKAFTGRVEDLEDALGDAKDQLKDFFSALTGALGDVRSANKDLSDSTKDFQNDVSDIRRNVIEDIDAIREKYDEMLPDKSTAEQRMANQGKAWDEWAHRALGTIDDVVSGDEAGWDARIRKEAEAVGIIQRDNESAYDFMHRVVKAFYENKIPNLIQTESSQYQTLIAEKAGLRDADIADANATADEAIAVAQRQYNEEQKILRQARNERALLGALQIAEVSGELGEFTRATWPGAMGDMLADADTFFSFWKEGMLDLDDEEAAAAVAGFMADLRFQLGETKGELQDNTAEASKLWKAGGEGAAAMATEIQNAKDKLIDLKLEQSQLELGLKQPEEGVDPELEGRLQGVKDQIADLEDQLGPGGVFGTMKKEIQEDIDEVDALQAELDTLIGSLTTFGTEGVTAVTGVDTEMVTATETTKTWRKAWDGFRTSAVSGFKLINKEIDDLPDTIEIDVHITTTYNPTVSTYEAISVISDSLQNLPSVVNVDVQFAGLAAARLAGEAFGLELGDAMTDVLLRTYGPWPWHAPFALSGSVEGAGKLASIGSFFVGLLDPIQEEYDALTERIEETDRLLQDQAFIRRLSAEQFLELQRNQNLLLEERNQLEDEYAAAQEATLRFERAKARVDLLQQQLSLVKLLYDLDIDPRGILEGIGFGIDAAAEDWVAAMAAAMEKLAQAAEDNLKNFLGISSPSQKMIEIGQEIQRGLLIGATQPLPRLAAPSGSTTQNTVEMTNDFSGAVINNGMDMAMFQAVIVQTIKKSVKGY